jgi:hypothetical protein
VGIHVTVAGGRNHDTGLLAQLALMAGGATAFVVALLVPYAHTTLGDVGATAVGGAGAPANMTAALAVFALIAHVRKLRFVALMAAVVVAAIASYMALVTLQSVPEIVANRLDADGMAGPAIPMFWLGHVLLAAAVVVTAVRRGGQDS